MIDFLSAVTATSVKFQKNKLLIIELEQTVNDHVNELQLMKHTEDFFSRFELETQEFSSRNTPIPLVLKTSPVPEYSEDRDAHCLLQSSIEYLEKRFGNFKEEPLSHFSVFYFKYWPNEDNDLLQYGRTEIKKLLAHYSELLTSEEKSNALREWTVLKNRVKTTVYSVYTDLLAARPEEIKRITCLIKNMVTISPSTAECERQFSAMNNVKSTLRNSLRQDTLDSLLRVQSTAQSSAATFDPMPAILHWMESGPGTRHLLGHRTPIRSVPKPKTKVTEDDNEDTREQ